jgi:putative cardiolipin synthase
MANIISHRTLLLILLVLTMSGCTTSRIDLTHYTKVPSWTIQTNHTTQLDDYFAHELTTHSPSTETGFYPLDKGHDALLARLAIIEAAQSSIDVQYYIFRDDEAGQLISWRLFEAAERGIRVRVLLDDMHRYDDNALVRFSSHPNIEVRMFNPHYLRTRRTLDMVSDFTRLNHRMHNKSLSVDAVVSVIGGRNIGNEYYSIQSDVEFADLDLLMVGKSVGQVNHQFDLYWNSDHSIPIEWLTEIVQSYSEIDVEAVIAKLGLESKFNGGIYDLSTLPFYEQLTSGNIRLYWGQSELLYDLPDKPDSKQSTLIDSLRVVLDETDDSFVLISPYFVPTKHGTQQLVNAVEGGREVIIVTNSLASNDVFAVHGWYAKYRQQLVSAGVQLWEVKPHAEVKKNWQLVGSSRSSLHAKAMILDKEKIFVGSMNWDPRSAHLNTEMGVVIQQSEYAQQAYQALLEAIKVTAYRVQIKDGNIVWFDQVSNKTYTSEPEAGFWLRLGAWFSGILPIEEQL